MKTLHMRVAAVVAAALLVGAPSATRAENVILHFWSSDGTNQENDWITIPLDDRGFFDASGTSETDQWTINWDLSGDADPVVNSNFSVVNPLGVPQDFNVSVFLPIFPALPAPTYTSGSIGLTLTDATGNGATLTNRANGAAIYTAKIDNVNYETLLDAPYSLVAPAFGSNNDSADFGLPGITQIGPAANTSIGIQVQFTLSSHDLAGVTSTFTVVPEPASLALAGLALLGCVALVRRR